MPNGVTSIRRLAAEPCFTVDIDDGRVQTSGPAAFFRGHAIEVADQAPDGIYASWSWDGRRLTIRNDRYGAAPLFFAHEGTRLSVSPSLVRLVECGASTTFDAPGLALFLRLGFFVGDDTPFAAIRSVPPGGTVTWEDGRVTVSGGYRFLAQQRIGRDEAVDGFIEIFKRAMRRRPPQGDDVVVPLSGGRDSRHILMELCESGAAQAAPTRAVTIPRYPPRPTEDERLAPIIARELGVPHTLLQQTASAFRPELRKNWETHLCADEHAWYVAMVDCLEGRATTIYDGLGGALSVPNRFLSRDTMRLIERGRFRDLATNILGALSRSGEGFLRSALRPEWRERLSLDVAIDRLAAELALHRNAADPVKSFNFWTRIRRELALTPYALMRNIPTVYSPYLDWELYDFLSSLPPEVMSPALSPSDKSFHSDAVLRGYPRYAHIPFEDRGAAKRDRRLHDATLVRDTGLHLLQHAGETPILLNRAHVLPRLALGVASRKFGERAGWMPGVALYLFQLDALARRRHAEVDGEEREPSGERSAEASRSWIQALCRHMS